MTIASTRFSLGTTLATATPNSARHHQRDGDISEQAMQFADSAFRFLGWPLRGTPVPGFIAVCLGGVT